MQKNILEKEWMSLSHFQLFDDVKNRDVSSLDKLIPYKKMYIYETNKNITIKRSEYDQELNLKKRLYSYKGPQDDFDKKEISKHIENLSLKFFQIKSKVQSKDSKVEKNNNQYNKDFDRFNIELAKLVNFSSLDDTYFSKLRTSIDDMKRLTLNLSDLEQFNAVLHEDWIEKE
jgi:hypothetical protein